MPPECDTATVTVTVDPVNDPPVATDDTDSTPEDTPVTTDVTTLTGNDNDPDGDPLTITPSGPTTTPNGGTVTCDATGCTYTPAPGFNGMDTYDYEICDNGSPALCDMGTVTINVGAVNDPPVAGDDTATTPQGTPVTIDATTLTGNDSDPDGDPLTITPSGPTTTPNGGTVTCDASGCTYTPDPAFSGTDTFTYEVCDNATPPECDTAVVTVTVDPQAVQLVIDDVTVTEGVTPVMTFTIEVQDLSGNPIRAQASDGVTKPIVLNADFDVSVDVVTADNTAVAGIDYVALPTTTVTIPAGSTSTTVDITVIDDAIAEPTETYFVNLSNATPANVTIADPQGIGTILDNDGDSSPPMAMPDEASTMPGEPVVINVLGNDTDDTGLDPSSVMLIDPVTGDRVPTITIPDEGVYTVNPDGTVTFEPVTTFIGISTVDYEVADISGNTTVATIRVGVFRAPAVIPTLSEWAMILMVLLMMVVAGAQLRTVPRRTN